MESVRNEYNELVWTCTLCSYSHKKKTNTFRHVEAKHVSCSYFCQICGAPQNCRNSLKQHMLLKHNQTLTFWNTYNIDKIVFWKGLDALVKEKMFQTETNGIKTWNCLECGYGTPKTTNIRKHIERMHMNVALSCDFCQRQFKSRNDLNVHLKTHIFSS